MDVQNKEVHYNIKLEDGETIEIKINGNITYSETIATGYIATINFTNREQKIEQEQI